MSDVDQLIEELFPNGGTEPHSGLNVRSMTHEPPASKADWDASDEERGDATDAKIVSVKPQASVDAKKNFISDPSKSYFDESDGEDFGPAGTVFTFAVVPFPFFPSDLGGACVEKCFVTNVGSKSLPHPTIARLLLFAKEGYSDRLTQIQLLERKGAFYALDAKFGNGASDRYAENMGCSGGCPVMVCRKCNYGVIRLQGAAWNDGEGRIDLYLTVRNYYPDWSRLANSFPVGKAKGAENDRVLGPSVGCAAYCCQCSWLTVKSAQEIIETRLSHTVGYVGKEDSCCFATQLPLMQGERRRPPLWVCRGHMPHA
ncbi:hypothetical protein C3747_63g51 [Trypanosoma cruzi]|uniref:Cilia- and flagella-associated protein 418 n=1 Tax=Trypanosoma cruzi TaxID=5693 RepID=A0A2V2WRX7_TRYCR|nr:hypothetical protein C3747_63g51 [Trypanosoma cruzi]RNC54566.1 hypothetical protein TcCL_ESM08008 [Trypanosoma cruzi]